MHITIAGKLGSGKSTVCGLLHARYGFEIYSTGAIQRKIAADMGISTIDLNRLMNEDPQYDHLLDDTVTRLSREWSDRTVVFDSRMAWKFACDSFKIYLIIDPRIAAERVYETRRSGVEAYSSVEEACEGLTARAQIENERFKAMYHTDNFDYRNYDLVLDTSFASPDEVCDAIYENYLAFLAGEKFECPRLVVSPKILYPTEKITDDVPDGAADAPVTLAVRDGYHYITEGTRTALSALRQGQVYLCARLGNAPAEWNADAVSSFEKAGSFSYRSYPKTARATAAPNAEA